MSKHKQNECSQFNSGLSQFVRNANEQERQRVYKKVIERAIGAQREVLRRQGII